MQTAINILENVIRKDEKNIRWYESNGYKDAAKSLQREVDELKMAIKFINEGICRE